MSQSQLESVQTEADELEAQLARVKRQLAEKTDECEAQAAQVKRQRTEEKEKYEERLLLLAQTAGLHTLKQVFKTPLQHLHTRLGPHQSCPEPVPFVPRTFGDILPWPEFVSRASQLEESLDYVALRYKLPSSTMKHATGFSSAAEVSEVRGVIMNLLYEVNDTARILRIKAEYSEGGSGRTASFMDLVLRKSGQLSDPKKLSALVLGAGVVKGQSQLDLKRGETKEAVLRDPECVDSVLLALQQVYGDAVIDEVPMLIISNYHVTVFLKRSEHVQDKRLWASPPVWWDQQQLTARSCWLWALHEATQMQHLKCKLPRTGVPQTVKQYETGSEMGSEEAPAAHTASN